MSGGGGSGDGPPASAGGALAPEGQQSSIKVPDFLVELDGVPTRLHQTAKSLIFEAVKDKTRRLTQYEKDRLLLAY